MSGLNQSFAKRPSPARGTAGSNPAPSTAMLSATDIAYIAGFFDGEGSVSFGWYSAGRKGSSVRKYGRLTATIAQTNEEVLSWIVEATGCGNVYIQNNARDQATNPIRKKCWQIRMHAGQARQFLKLVRPFLRVKGDVVDEKIALDARHVKPRKSKPSDGPSGSGLENRGSPLR